MATINYNGMELEEFVPEDSCFFDPPKKAVFISADHIPIREKRLFSFDKRFHCPFTDEDNLCWPHCALLPDPPKPRRATWTCQGGPMPKDDYPLHPGQIHAEPYYCTIPLEEYENLKDEISHLRSLNETMRAELERRGVIVVPPSAELDKYEKEWVEAELENPKPIITSTDFKEEK